MGGWLGVGTGEWADGRHGCGRGAAASPSGLIDVGAYTEVAPGVGTSKGWHGHRHGPALVQIVWSVWEQCWHTSRGLHTQKTHAGCSQTHTTMTTIYYISGIRNAN